jgi:segregation and condensation protein B
MSSIETHSEHLAYQTNETEDFSATIARRDRRLIEALLFASQTPLSSAELQAALPSRTPVDDVLAYLIADYATRGINLVQIGGKWTFQTAADLGYILQRERQEPRRLSRAALETLSIIAYHQPVTRGEIENIRGVATSKGTIDVLLEAGWIRLRGRRRSPGRPVTFGTTEGFLVQFGLNSIDELPGLEELKGTGFFDGRIPSGLHIPHPTDQPELQPDEDPLDEDFFVLLAQERLEGGDEPLTDQEIAT